LCKTVIDSNHIVDALVTLFKDEDDEDVLAMRTTRINTRNMEIAGAYACAEGYGRLLQEHTENLIRSNIHGVFTPSAHYNKPVYFTLNTLPTAKGFWRHMGFEETGVLNEEGHMTMRKRLDLSDDESVVTTNKHVKHRR
jgi:hypothetical protein